MDKIKWGSFANQDYYCRFKPSVRTITFTAPSSTLTDFPALVKSDATFNITEEHGYDVHFQDLAGNELYFDLDYYDSSTGKGAWWVQIPTLSSSGSTTIKMIYGDPSITTNQSAPLTVWSDYAAVYHFEELTPSSQLNRATGTRSPSGLGNTTDNYFTSSAKGTGRFLRFPYSGNGEDRTQGIRTSISLTSTDYAAMLIMNTNVSPATSCGFYLFAPNVEGALGYTNSIAINVNSNATCSLGAGDYPQNVNVSASAVSGDVHLFGTSLEVYTNRFGQIDGTIQTGGWGEGRPFSDYSELISLVPGQNGTYSFEVDELRLCKLPHTQAWLAYEYSNYINHTNNVIYGVETK